MCKLIIISNLSRILDFAENLLFGYLLHFQIIITKGKH